MIDILNSKSSKFIDSYCIDVIGIPSLILMEHAAEETCIEVNKELKKLGIKGRNRRLIIFSGVGNNGADGLACGRILDKEDIDICVYIVGNVEKGSKEFGIQRSMLDNMGILVKNANSADINEIQNDICESDIIIDAIFGIGLSRNVEGKFFEVINLINESNKRVVSVDVPSGLNSDTGKVMGISVIADKTVTFGNVKSGLLLCDGRNYSGKIKIKDIGFRREAYNTLFENEEIHMFSYDADDLVKRIKRNPVSNKGSFGKTAVIGGNEFMFGAPYMAGYAALRTGTGIVKIFTHEIMLDGIRNLLPEAICGNYEQMYLSNDISMLDDCKAVIIGPGLGVSVEAKTILRNVLCSGKKYVIDADALNIISEDMELLKTINGNAVITPHIREMSLLAKKSVREIRENIVESGVEFARKYECICVIKDSSTIVTDGKSVYINRTGNSGMATGGSGDVLAGIIGGLISQGMDIFEAACMGVYMHGMAGDMAKTDYSEYGIKATDIIKYLGKI